MPLRETAFLEIDDGNGNTGTFELNIDLEETTEVEKSYVMANRGQFIQQIADNEVVDLGVEDISRRRTGFTIDGGAGRVEHTVQFTTGLDDVTWGDGDGGDGPSNVTKSDASGADVKPLDRKQVLAYWLRRTRTDSFGQARFHWGQWTDGTLGGADAGVYDQPIPVSINDANLDGPPVDDSSVFSGTLTFRRVSLFPTEDVPSWVTNAAEKIADQIDGVYER